MPQVGFAISAIATTAGQVGAWFAAGSITANLLTSVALSALQSAVARATMKEPRQPGIKTKYTTDGGTRPMSFILGRYATAGHMVCPPMSHGRPGFKTPNNFLTYVVSMGSIPGQTLETVIVDDEEVTLTGTDEVIQIGGAVPSGRPDWWYRRQDLPVPGEEDPAPPPTVAVGKRVSGDLAGRVWVKYYDGSQTTADPYLLAVYGPGTTWATDSERPWTSDMVGVGTPYAIVTFQYDRKFFTGMPRVKFVMGGIPLYDIRQDSSAGGSGTQRWSNPSTWAPSHNPMVQTYNILRGIPISGGPFWGLGAEAPDLPFSSWLTAMNSCDETVSGAPRYRAGLEIDVDEEPLDIIDELQKTCSAQVSEFGGVWKPRVGGPKAPIYFFSDDDLISDREASNQPFPGLAQTYNGVQINYPEPDQLWQAKDAPPRFNADYEAADQGRRLIANLNLVACPYEDQVQRVGRAYVEDERRFRRHVITLPPEADILEALDSVGWSSAENGYGAKVFEVVEAEEDSETGCVTLSIRERDNSDYGWVPGYKLPSSIPSTRVVRPDPVVPPFFGAEGIALAGRRPAVRLRWGGYALEGITGIRWQLRRDGDVMQGTMAEPEDGEHIVSEGVLPDTDYQARIAFTGPPGRALGWTGWESLHTDDIRFGWRDVDFEEIVQRVLDSLSDFEDWVAGTPDLIRNILDQMAVIRDLLADSAFSDLLARDQMRRDLAVEVGAARAAFAEEIGVIITTQLAATLRTTRLEASLRATTASVTTEQLARASADSALSARIDTVIASLGSYATSTALGLLSSRVDTIDGEVQAQADAILTTNARVGRVSGNGTFRVSSAAAPSGAQSRAVISVEATADDSSHSAAIMLDANTDGTSDIGVVAGRFYIATGTGAGASRRVPFVIDGGAIYMNTAIVKHGSFGTLMLEDNAITVPASQTLITNLAGTGDWRTANSASFVLPQAGQVSIDWFACQGYKVLRRQANGIRLFIDGTERWVRGAPGDGRIETDWLAMGWTYQLAAGSHTFRVDWLGGDADIVLSSRTLKIQGSMR